MITSMRRKKQKIVGRLKNKLMILEVESKNLPEYD